MSFAIDMTKWVDKTMKGSEELMENSTKALFITVIETTPVGNPDHWKSKPPKGYVGGRLRANWQTTNGAPATGDIDSTNKRRSSDEARQHLQQVDFSEDFNLFLTNNLPYAERVEEGWSKQRPEGMVKKAMIQIKSNIDNARL